MTQAPTIPAPSLQVRWQLLAGGACAAALVLLAVTDRPPPLLFGLLWTSCVALFAAPGGCALPAPEALAGRPALRRAAVAALLACALMAAAAGAWGFASGWLRRQQLLGGLSGPQTLLYTVLCAGGAAAATVAAVDAWRRRPTRRRAVVAGLLVTLALAAWFTVAVTQVGYLEGVGDGLEAGWRAALRALSAFADRPAGAVYTALALAAPFGLVVAAHGFGLRGVRVLLALGVGTAAWSGLLLQLARPQDWLHPGRTVALLAPPLLLGATLVRWLGAGDAQGGGVSPVTRS